MAMSDPKPQNLKNHVRMDLAFHGVVFLVLLPNLVYALVHLVRHPGLCSAWILISVLAVLVLAFKIRMYSLKVQDRIIRLEERLRLQSLAPAAWQAKIQSLSVDQLIGLRFAADDEVIPLAQQALEHGLNRKQIKEQIKNWRTDNWRI